MKRILVVSVNWLGDSIFSLPVFENLKKHYPDSLIGVLAPQYLKEIYLLSPYIDIFYGVSDKIFYKDLFYKVRLIGQLRKMSFDTVFFLHRSFTRAMLAFLAGIPQRVGYERKKVNSLLTQRIPAVDPNSMHRVDYYLGVVSGAGIPIVQRQYQLTLSEEHMCKAEKFLQEVGVGQRQYICMHTAANWVPKRWFPERFSQTADALIERKNCAVIFTGSGQDAQSVQKMIQNMRNGRQAVNAAGRTDMITLAALFKMSSAVISSDSGPLHVASAVGASCVALFGPTSEKITGPRGTGNNVVIRKETSCVTPCYHDDCVDYRCMEEITVDDVVCETERFIR